MTVGVMRILLTLLIFLTDLIVSRYLGVALKGEYFFLISAVLLLATFLTGGLHLGNVYYSRFFSFPELAANSLLYLGVMWGLLGIIGYPLLAYLPTLSQGSVWLKVIFINCLILECAFAIFLNFFVISSQLFRYALVRLLNRGLLLFLVLAAWFSWQASLELLLGFHLLTLFLALLTMGLLFPRREGKFQVRWRSLGKCLGYGMKSQGMVGVDLSTQRLNIIFLGFWASPIDNGLYSVALNFGQALWLLANALIVVIQSGVSKSPEKQLSDLEKLSRHSLFLMIGGGLVLALTADLVIRWGYGPDFQGAGTLLRAMLPGLVAYSLYSLFSSFMVTHGMAGTAFWCSLGGLLVNVGLGIILIPSQGGLGAARALNWGFLTSTVLLLIMLSTIFKVRLSSLLILKKSDVMQVGETLRRLAVSKTRG
jgi:O-antigen/teichoic acid export membrane protein